MENKQPGRRPTVDGSATYRTRAQRCLDARWADRIGGMKITESRGADGEAENVLVGRLALSDVPNTPHLYHLNPPKSS
jgi:hypothetical protein